MGKGFNEAAIEYVQQGNNDLAGMTAKDFHVALTRNVDVGGRAMSYVDAVIATATARDPKGEMEELKQRHEQYLDSRSSGVQQPGTDITLTANVVEISNSHPFAKILKQKVSQEDINKTVTSSWTKDVINNIDRGDGGRGFDS